MSDLSPELRKLVLATRRANLATHADSARVLFALRARMGDAVLGLETVESMVAGTSSAMASHKIVILSLAGLAMLCGLWSTAAHRGEASSIRNSISSAAVTSSVSMNAALEAPSTNAQATPANDTNAAAADTIRSADRVKVRSAASHGSRDRLAQEVALLARAEAALHGGSPALALQILNEHDRLFRNGLLAEERIAARFHALCALGRAGEANSQLAQLSPKSLHGVRSCVAQGNQ